MLVDLPPHVKHNGPIYSVSCHPDGKRFATSGSDNSVRIWSLRHLLSSSRADLLLPHKLLATLTDNTEPVNVVRFSHQGHVLATGSDDKLVALCELRPGRALASFGSSDGPNIENWRVQQPLRGHAQQVTDLSWSHDDAMLASCSVDNCIFIWDPARGVQLHVLKGHQGFVKGVAFDPVGTYLASQGDDRSVVIWRTDGWQQAARITAPFQHGFNTSTFFLRLSWSPVGSHLGAGNSYDSPCHVSCQFTRDAWDAPPQQLVGHTATITAVCYNPHLMYPPTREGGGFDRAQAESIIATGGQDKRISIWRTGVARPLVVTSRLFSQTVVDLAWTPDGYSLLACSTDGKVAVLSFEAAELGQALTKEEHEQLMSELYGDRQARGTAFVESADQLQLEAAAAKAAEGLAALPAAAASGLSALSARLEPHHGQPSRLGLGVASNGPRRINPQPMLPVAPRLEHAANGLSSAPAPAPMLAALPAQAAATLAPGMQPLQLSNGTAAQRAGPRPNEPPAAAQPSAAAAAAAAAGSGSGDAAGVGAKRKASAAAPTARSPKRMAPERLGAAGPSAAPDTPASLVGTPGQPAAGGVMAAAAAAQPVLAPPPLLQQLSARLGQEALPSGDQEQPAQRVLLVKNDLRPGTSSATITCSAGTRRLWTDVIAGHVTLVAGSMDIAACALADGTVQVFTRSGRRLLPGLKLGGGLRFLAVHGWSLLAVALDGALRVLDMQLMEGQLEATVAPLLAGAPAGTAVTDVRLSQSGAPIAVLSSQAAYAYHRGLRCWAVLADAAFASSAFMSVLPPLLAGAGELARAQADAAGSHSLPGVRSVHSALAAGAARQAADSRAHLEANIGAALLLGSAAEWRRWLLTYVRHLAGQADEVRLREVCEDLLGPPRPVEASAAAAEPRSWQPTVLGLDRRRLLRDEVLPAVASNRANQRLVAEMKEALDELPAAGAEEQDGGSEGPGAMDTAAPDQRAP